MLPGLTNRSPRNNLTTPSCLYLAARESAVRLESMSCWPGSICFFSQEQPHYPIMSISCSPYEWRHTSAISLVHMLSLHLNQDICNFGNAEVQETAKCRKPPAIRSKALRKLFMDHLPATLKGIWQIRYETVELIKKLERKMFLCNLRTLSARGIPNIKNIQGKVCLRG